MSDEDEPRDVRDTLGELERRLLDLERELRTQAGSDLEAASVRSPPPAPPRAAAPPPPAPEPVPAAAATAVADPPRRPMPNELELLAEATRGRVEALRESLDGLQGASDRLRSVAQTVVEDHGRALVRLERATTPGAAPSAGAPAARVSAPRHEMVLPRPAPAAPPTEQPAAPAEAEQPAAGEALAADAPVAETTVPTPVQTSDVVQPEAPAEAPPAEPAAPEPEPAERPPKPVPDAPAEPDAEPEPAPADEPEQPDASAATTEPVTEPDEPDEPATGTRTETTTPHPSRRPTSFDALVVLGLLAVTAVLLLIGGGSTRDMPKRTTTTTTTTTPSVPTRIVATPQAVTAAGGALASIPELATERASATQAGVCEGRNAAAIVVVQPGGPVLQCPGLLAVASETVAASGFAKRGSGGRSCVSVPKASELASTRADDQLTARRNAAVTRVPLEQAYAAGVAFDARNKLTLLSGAPAPGEPCVKPTPATLQGGSYPLATRIVLYAPRSTATSEGVRRAASVLRGTFKGTPPLYATVLR